VCNKLVNFCPWMDERWQTKRKYGFWGR
jgi:hypothetical protein